MIDSECITIDDLIAEKSIHVLHAGILRWRVRCRRLELQVDRLEHELAEAIEDRDRLRTLADQRLDECRRLVDDKKRLTAANIELRQEVTQARDEAGRLRQAAEHAREALEWGMGHAD